MVTTHDPDTASLRAMAADILQLREELAAAKATNAQQQQQFEAALGELRTETDEKLSVLQACVDALEEEKKVATQKIAALESAGAAQQTSAPRLSTYANPWLFSQLDYADPQARGNFLSPEPTKSEEQVDQKPKRRIQITIEYQGTPFIVKVIENLQFHKIFDVAADRFSKAKGSLQFMYEGARVRPDETPAMLGMEDKAQMQAYTGQIA